MVQTPFKHFRTGLIIFLFCVSSIFLFSLSGKAQNLNVQQTLIAHDNSVQSIDMVLAHPNDTTVPFSFISQAPLNLILLNETEYGQFLLGQPFNYYGKYLQNTSINAEWNLTSLASEYNIPYVSFQGAYEAQFLILINNTSSQNITFQLRLNYQSVTLSALENTGRLGLILMFAVLSLFLFVRSRQFKQEQEEYKAKFLQSYSIAFLFGFLDYLMWEIQKWTLTETGNNLFFTVNVGTNFFFRDHYQTIQVINLALLGITVLFLIRQLELVVLKKKHAYISVDLFCASIMMVISLFLPIIFDIIFLWYVIALVIAIIGFVGIYLKTAFTSNGYVRMKALFVVIGVMAPYMVSFIQGNWIPNIIGYMISVTGLVLFYYGAVSE